MKAVLAGDDLRYERMVKRKDGSTFPAEISLKMIDNGMVQVIFHDISRRRAQEEKIGRLSRIQSVLSGINSAIVRIRDRQVLLEEACRIAATHGAFRIAVIGLRSADGNFAPCAWAGAGAEFFQAMAAANRAPALSPAGVAARAIRQRHTVFDNDITGDPAADAVRAEAVRQGSKSVVALPLITEGEVAGIFVLYSGEKNAFDDDELKLLEELAGDVSFALTFIAQQEKVNYLAYYDALTGLPNRSLFFDRLGLQLANAERERQGTVLAIFDIDRFRMVNVTLGRHAGDQLIKSIAERLKGAVREGDTVARLGADRFAFVASGNWATREISLLIEARSRALFGRVFPIADEELRVAATAGIAVYPGDGKDADVLLGNAEAALRDAKKQNLPLRFYSPEMNATAAESLRLENRLRRAIPHGELELWYQPKLELKTRRILGMEALMRWRDPESGLVSPAKFIPVMEQTGIILDAGSWALSRVAVDCRAWAAAGIKPPRIAVNVSPIQLRQKDFVGRVIEAAANTEAEGGALDLEVTESVIMENVDENISKLQTIRGLGVEIYVDDFGTGYSSLAYIARLPIHALKIDRSFVVGMTQNEDSLNIVNSVISLAHSMKLRVVAEGVETEAQAILLDQLGCDQFQGFLYSKPLPPADIASLLGKPAQPSRRAS
jgi:diguanylate cyclase (GGDEF)-like protein